MLPTLEEAMEMAKTMHDEGFLYSEAYPVVRWKRNGWTETNDMRLFKLLDSALLLMRLSDEHRTRVSTANSLRQESVSR